MRALRSIRRLVLPVLAALSVAAAAGTGLGYLNHSDIIKVWEHRDAAGRFTDLDLVGNSSHVGFRSYTYLLFRPEHPGYAEWVATFNRRDLARARGWGGFGWFDGEDFAWGQVVSSHTAMSVA